MVVHANAKQDIQEKLTESAIYIFGRGGGIHSGGCLLPFLIELFHILHPSSSPAPIKKNCVKKGGRSLSYQIE
jgi:hypothetical protein